VLRHQLATDSATLTSLAPEWARLLAGSRHDLVMRGPVWLLSWWRVFGALNGRRARVVSFWRGSELVGVFPLLSRPAFGLTRIELLGTGEQERDEVCSEHLGPVVAPGEEQAVARAFVALLERDALGPWHQLDLQALSGEDAMAALLCEALRGVGRVSFDVVGSAPFARLPATWGDYLSSLPSSRRQRVRRILGAFERWTGGNHAFEIATDPSMLERGLDILERLHAERWREVGRSGAFASPLFRAFHRRVAPLLLEQGALELAWLVVRGRPVTALYNLICNGRVRFYQSGRALQIPAGVSVGVATHLYAMQRAIVAHRPEYDFLGGLGRYKLELSHGVRPLLRLTVTRRSAVTDLQRTADLLWRAARFWHHETTSGARAPPPPMAVASA